MPFQRLNRPEKVPTTGGAASLGGKSTGGGIRLRHKLQQTNTKVVPNSDVTAWIQKGYTRVSSAGEGHTLIKRK